jgi:hypothetical protein
MDIWSQSLFQRELELLYSNAASGAPVQVGQLPHSQFSEFATWQVRELAIRGFEKNVSYWKECWTVFGTGLVTYKDLPFALDRPAQHPGGAGYIKTTITPDQAEVITRRSVEFHATLYSFWLAALLLLLSKYTGKTISAVWVNFGNRRRRGSEYAIGWFTNSHLIGLEIDSAATCSELVKSVRDTVFRAHEHAETPACLVHRIAGLAPPTSDVMIHFDSFIGPRSVQLEPYSGQRLDVGRVALPRHQGELNWIRGLYVALSHSSEEMSLTAFFAPDRFLAEDIRQFLKTVEFVALTLAENPGEIVRTILTDLSAVRPLKRTF